MEHRALNIEGMSCGHCVARVKRTLESVPGVSVTDVQIGSARLAILDPAAVTEAIRALDDAGFPAREA